ncbi:single-stranded DNA-binding protein [Candidatus Parcubacteria bacterium]|nr:MAG: single-stranded DNA-binding protein [Candidatus Parcubacteria bacterium]
MYQKIQIIGHLGNDPQMRYTSTGSAVCNFSVAVNRKYTNSKGEIVKETAWFRVATWGKLAENCNQYLRKGRQVFVEGRLVPDPNTGGPRVYQRNDGTFGASFEVNAITVKFLDNSKASSTNVADEAGDIPAGIIEEDIPF